MKCVYINLERATSRRDSMENLFSKYNSQNWPLERFSAIDVKYVAENKIQGRLSDVEKACLLSHRSVMLENLGSKDSVWILEDDVTFSPHTLGLIENFFKIKESTMEWDIVFTDVGIPTIGLMAELFVLRRKLMETKSIECLNLKSIPFFGTTSYIVNKHSLKKVAELIGGAALDIPLDLLYRKLAREGKLNAYVTFPYLTTDSDEAANSSIQKSEFAQTDLIWSLFRRLTWLDGDSFDPTPLLNEIWSGLDKRSQLYGVLWAAMADPSFKPK